MSRKRRSKSRWWCRTPSCFGRPRTGRNAEQLRSAARLLAEAQWPAIVAGELGKNPKALPALLDLAEALGAPVVDADGRYGFRVLTF